MTPILETLGTYITAKKNNHTLSVVCSCMEEHQPDTEYVCVCMSRLLSFCSTSQSIGIVSYHAALHGVWRQSRT
jgi:hypothetical protein